MALDDGVKWTFLEHKGPLFTAEYDPLPKDVSFRYNNEVLHLSNAAEEVAGYYARLINHEYSTKKVFNDNFFDDWRAVMTEGERAKILELKYCDFGEMHDHFRRMSEQNRKLTKVEKAARKAEKDTIQEEFGFCVIDGRREKLRNFRVEPPGLLRNRGDHPMMGKVKRRILPENVTINCSEDSKKPAPPHGHEWQQVVHNPRVTWLASWMETIQGQVRYVMLHPSSKLKGDTDYLKFETAHELRMHIDKIRDTYRTEWEDDSLSVRQRAIAVYFIDKLALRAGNEKKKDQADTVGCCSLRVEHVDLHEEKDSEKYVVVFNFPGKDSMRYFNEVSVEKRVFMNLMLFKKDKKTGDGLFHLVTPPKLNEHLKELMPGLTIKVFRTYNASVTMQEKLQEMTLEESNVEEKVAAFKDANRCVGLLCNHRRTLPRGPDVTLVAGDSSESEEEAAEETTRVAPESSKLNYIDPRIVVAWCKKHRVPIEKVFTKAEIKKFWWAIKLDDEHYVF